MPKPPLAFHSTFETVPLSLFGKLAQTKSFQRIEPEVKVELKVGCIRISHEKKEDFKDKLTEDGRPESL